MAIFYMQYEAIPLPESEDFEEWGGAYVNCWVKAESEDEASKLASASIHERGGKIIAVEEECREVTQDVYAEDEEGRAYFDQAALDGECYVYHQWPIDMQEGDTAH